MILTIIAFVFVIGIVVLVHELGHFWVAKMNGIYVLTFSFGLGPKLLKKRIGDTEYALSAIPFGGYVKFAGESYDDEEAGEEAAGTEGRAPAEGGQVSDAGGGVSTDAIDVPEDQLYRNKGPLAKMAVVTAGPLMNAALAVVLYILIAWFQGLYVVPGTVVKEVASGTPADAAGFLPGDRILAVNGEKFRFWSDLETLVTFEEGVSSSFTVLRDADTLVIDVTPEFSTETGYWRIGIDAPLPAKIGTVKRDSPAARAGLRPGAVILAINDTTITYWRELEEKIHARPGIEMHFTWELEGERHSAVIVPDAVPAPSEGERLDVVKIGGIGIGPSYERVSISFGEAFNHGLRACYSILGGILDFIWKMLTGKATMRAVGGPIRVGMMAGDMIRWGFSYLIYFLAFFSLNLTIFNLLPILPFDGGHFVIHLYEFVSRRRINRKVHAVMLQIGYFILIALLVAIFLIDMLNIFR